MNGESNTNDTADTRAATYSFFAQGTPRPYRKDRVKGGHNYKPQRLQKWQRLIYLQLLEQCDRPSEPHSGPVRARLRFWFDVPKSWPQWRKEYEAGEGRPKTPDWDNCSKAVLDSLEGTLIEDDRQVYEVVVEQRYTVDDKLGASVPGVEVQLWCEPERATTKKELEEKSLE